MLVDMSKLYWPPLGKLFDLLNREDGPSESDKGQRVVELSKQSAELCYGIQK